VRAELGRGTVELERIEEDFFEIAKIIEESAIEKFLRNRSARSDAVAGTGLLVSLTKAPSLRSRGFQTSERRKFIRQLAHSA
jgi:hypothetical protein